MNRILPCLLATIILMTGTRSFAQTEQHDAFRKLKIGIDVAPVYSWMRPTTGKSNNGQYAPENRGGQAGFMYGITGMYYFSENYGLVVGVQADMTGGKIYTKRVTGNAYDANVVNTADFNYHLSYLEIPVAIRLRTNEFSGFRFFGQAGLTPAVNIAKKANYTVSYNDAAGTEHTVSGQRERIKGTLAIAPVMLQTNIGLGVEYALNAGISTYAGIFFNNGFLPDATNPKKYKLPYDLPFSDGNTRLNSLALKIGLLF